MVFKIIIDGKKSAPSYWHPFSHLLLFPFHQTVQPKSQLPRLNQTIQFELEENRKGMTESINITEAGRKYLQLFNIPIEGSPKQQEQPRSAIVQLPVISMSSHEAQLHQLPFKLNRLYRENLVISEAKNEYNQNIKRLNKQLLRDLGYVNDYTNRRAKQLVNKLLSKNIKQEQKVSISMEISKNRNYLARINFLHSEQNYKCQQIKKSLEKIVNKENSQ